MFLKRGGLKIRHAFMYVLVYVKNTLILCLFLMCSVKFF